jgi:protein-disulfide isomerase
LTSLLLLLAVACQNPTPEGAPGASGASSTSAASPSEAVPGEVAGRIGDVAISLAEVDAKAGAALVQARQQLYDARRAALDELVLDRLLDAEAKKRGIEKTALLKAEVDDKADPVQEAKIVELFEANKARLGGAPFDDVRPKIVEFLGQQAKAERFTAYTDELRAVANVEVLIDPPRVPVDVPANAPRYGSVDAPVQIVEWSDFECPYCSRGASTVDELKAKYGDKISVVFRHFPLDFHNNARKAAEAAICAQEQGKFWEYHDKLFANQRALGLEDLGRYADELTLDRAKFQDCLSSGRHAGQVQADFEAGQKVGVTGTPGFFVNGRFLGGALPVDAFSKIIDEEIERVTR